jgi:hypothetical protein
MPENVQPTTIYVKDEKKTKKKRKYSKGIQSIQMSEVALTRGANRLASAVADGLREYRLSRDKSSLKKRDGMIIDYVPNVGRGISKGIRRASSVSYDLSKAINHREFQNAMRFIAKTMTSFKFPS